MNRIHKILISLFAVLAISTPAFAQQASNVLDNTTLNGAVTQATTTVVITSATLSGGATTGAIAAGMFAFTEGELMQIRAVSGTTLTVSRGIGGTSAAAHATSSVILIGPQSYFQLTDPSFGKPCTTATMQYRPWVNSQNANVWLCKSSVWTATNYRPITYNSVDPY